MTAPKPTTGTPLRAGHHAPDIALVDHTGKPVRLSDFRGRVVVIFFFPGAFTPACSAEACGFRDSYQEFTSLGATVIGISGNSEGTLGRFAGVFSLPFILLSDAEGAARRAFGVPRLLGLFPGRYTYVVDRDGVIALAFGSPFRAGRHVAEALRVVKKLSGSGTRPLPGSPMCGH